MNNIHQISLYSASTSDVSTLTTTDQDTHVTHAISSNSAVTYPFKIPELFRHLVIFLHPGDLGIVSVLHRYTSPAAISHAAYIVKHLYNEEEQKTYFQSKTAGHHPRLVAKHLCAAPGIDGSTNKAWLARKIPDRKSIFGRMHTSLLTKYPVQSVTNPIDKFVLQTLEKYDARIQLKNPLTKFTLLNTSLNEVSKITNDSIKTNEEMRTKMRDALLELGTTVCNSETKSLPQFRSLKERLLSEMKRYIAHSTVSDNDFVKMRNTVLTV